MKKIMKQIYARMWLAWRLLRLHFVRMPESEDGKSQEQLLEEIRKRSGQTLRAVMILGRTGYILAEPVRCFKGKSFFLRGKFHFCQHEIRSRGRKEIQLNSIFSNGNQITALGDELAVGFFAQMCISLGGQGLILFFPDHQPFGFVSEIISVILLTDADNRFGAEITLFEFVKCKLLQL